MNTSKDPIPEMKPVGIAEEWIRYLRKKNSYLSMLLFMMILVAMAASFFAYKQYTELAHHAEKQGLLRADLSLVALERDRLTERNTELAQQINDLNEQLLITRSELDTQTKLSLEKSQISEQMLSALKEKNQMLELSAVQSEKDYQQMQAMLGSKVGVSEKLTRKLDEYRAANKRLQAQTNKQEKELAARKIAYTALVGRLKDANYDLDQAKIEIAKLGSEKSSLEQINLASSVAEVSQPEPRPSTDSKPPLDSGEPSSSNQSLASNEPFAIQDERPKLRVVFQNGEANAADNSVQSQPRTVESANQIVLQ